MVVNLLIIFHFHVMHQTHYHRVNCLFITNLNGRPQHQSNTKMNQTTDYTIIASFSLSKQQFKKLIIKIIIKFTLRSRYL